MFSQVPRIGGASHSGDDRERGAPAGLRNNSCLKCSGKQSFPGISLFSLLRNGEPISGLPPRKSALDAGGQLSLGQDSPHSKIQQT